MDGCGRTGPGADWRTKPAKGERRPSDSRLEDDASRRSNRASRTAERLRPKDGPNRGGHRIGAVERWPTSGRGLERHSQQAGQTKISGGQRMEPTGQGRWLQTEPVAGQSARPPTDNYTVDGRRMEPTAEQERHQTVGGWK